LQDISGFFLDALALSLISRYLPRSNLVYAKSSGCLGFFHPWAGLSWFCTE